MKLPVKRVDAGQFLPLLVTDQTQGDPPSFRDELPPTNSFSELPGNTLHANRMHRHQKIEKREEEKINEK
ncbi:MAG: hypothetical protein ABFD24_03450 [Anaerolineaceae bacterium]